MSFPAHSRGASLFGVLMLVGILSSVAVGLESSYASVNSSALLAQGAMVSPRGAPSGIGSSQLSRGFATLEMGVNSGVYGIKYDSDAFKNLTCGVGNDFIAKLDRVEDQNPSAIYYSDSKGNPTSIKAQCVYSPRGGQFSGRSEWGATIPSRSCGANGANPWRCYVKVCWPSSKTGGGEVCRVGKSPLDVGQSVSEGVDSNQRGVAQGRAETILNDPTLNPEEKKAALESIKTPLDQGQQNALLQSFQAEKKQVETELIASKKEEQELRSLAEGCDGFGVVSCDVYTEGADRAKQKNEELQEKLEALSQAEKFFLSPADSPKDVNEKKKESQPEVPRNEHDQTFIIYRERPSDPYRDFFGKNANQDEDRYLCERYNDRDACMRISTGGYGSAGARGGYPGGGQSSRCGGQQPNFGGGLGGIITGVISLFSRNNNSGDCTADGVPKPRCTLTASPKNISKPGEQVTLSWQSDDAFAATLSNRGSVGVNGSEVVQPQQTTTYMLSLQGYKNTQTGQVLSGQCSTQVTVGGTTTPTGNDPKAQISCSPQSADVGMSVAVSFSCLNSNTSSGSGFSTNNQLSGSATPVVTAPTIGSNSVTYGVTCSKEGKTDSAQCTVEVNKTSIVLVANPKNVERREESNIGWVTAGMQSCTISSPQLSDFTNNNTGNTSTSGVVRTPPLTNDATFVLTCTSRSGATKTAETKVEVEN